MKRKTTRLREKLADMMEIPEETLNRNSSLYVIGNRSAEITGSRCVQEYSDTCVVLRTKNGTVTLQGTELEICSLLGDQITVRGEILCISFARTPDCKGGPA